ncbi:MAG TPA: SMC-Scp complex subunit ScpB [Candidatus Obscuribacterales bacterium]
MSLKAKIEAVLFLTDKPIRAQAIARIVDADVQLVRQNLIELIHDYETRGGGLEIAQDNGYIIQVKDEYAQIIEEFLPVEMSAALVRTLSAIAIKQPVAQSEIVKIRGAGAYDHIRELLARELIARKEEGGRSPILTTTKKFQEYFRLTRDAKSLRQHLRKQEQTGQLQIESPAGSAETGEGHEQAEGVAVPPDEVLDKLLDSVLDTTEGDRPSGEDPTEDAVSDPPSRQSFDPRDGEHDNPALGMETQASDTISEPLP